jgi:Flp pilus assembly protein TadD
MSAPGKKRQLLKAGLPPQPASCWRVAVLCLVLAAITFAVFGQTAGFAFVNYDDNIYVYDNPVVEKGFSLKGFVWALTCGEIGHWHPLTWLTHMADCQIYGLWAGGHHLTNVALHTAAAVLLFLALREMTGSLWRSAFVAAVFAIHPLRVESVAWIAERKDVLSGVFFVLTLWAYARYARRPSVGRYVVVAAGYGLGLLCKNTLVTLPFVLLLLDWWPLHRLTRDVVKEKIPLFLLSVGSCLTTFLVPEKTFSPDQTPFLERIANAVVSYGIYVRQMVVPAGLAIPYLNAPSGVPFWEVALVFVLLAAISISVLACRKGHPYLLVGWLWYLGMLVPAIGFVQISYYAHADRYTYLPGIGLVLAGTWAVGDWSAGWKHRRAVLGGLMAAVLGALMVCAWIQTGYWKDSATLWTHTLACTTDNYVAHSNLGNALLQKGRVDEAITHYQSAVQIDPRYADAQFNLGNAFLQKGRADQAISQYQKALEIQPDFAAAHLNLGNGFSQQGRMDQAISQYQKALEINPDDEKAHNNLGNAFLQKGNVSQAITHFQQALEIKPADPSIQNNLAWLLATGPQASLRNGTKAVELARQANALTGGENPIILHTLAAAYAEAGRFPQAVETARHASQLAEAQSNPGLARQLQFELNLYRAGNPIPYP